MDHIRKDFHTFGVEHYHCRNNYRNKIIFYCTTTFPVKRYK